MKIDLNSRFQDQPWHIKLWRYRYYLCVPYYATIYRYCSNRAEKEWKCAFSIAIGDAQIKMKWFYTIEEVKERLKGKKEK